MKTKWMRAGGSVGLVALTALAAPLSAQQSAAHAHMGHVADAFSSTPEGQGLLPTAVAEAEIAARHAELALTDPTDLAAMQRHTQHVMHAVNPERVEQGPGLGFGVRQGAEGVVRHITMAGEHESASENVSTHATHVATAAQNVITWSDEIIRLGDRILTAPTAGQAAPLLEEMAQLTNWIVSGHDANEDGRIGWQEGEGGLAQAQQHMTLMKRGEGMNGG